MLRKSFIIILLLLNVTGLYAQKQNPMGIYHMVSITGKNGTEPAPYDQYKICTDSMTWMVNVTEDGSINEHGERTNRPYFKISDNDHMVFNYTGEQPDATDATKSRIYDSGKKGFKLKWWSTSQNHRVFPHNDWCTEEYKSDNFSPSGKKIFDLLYSTKSTMKKDGIQGQWKVTGAIKMGGSKIVDEWQKHGTAKLSENDIVPYQDKYAIIDDQYVFIAHSEALLNQQTPSIYGYLQKYQISDESGRSVTAQILTNDNTRPAIYEFYRISDDRMIVRVEYSLIVNDRINELSDHGYEIWDRYESRMSLINQLTSATPLIDTGTPKPDGLYRFVAGGSLCRIRESADSVIGTVMNGIRMNSYTERYRLCTDTANWTIRITNSTPKSYHGYTLGDSIHLDYQAKDMTVLYGSPASIYSQDSDVSSRDRWTLFGCTETGFSECQQNQVWTFDKRSVTPLAKDVLDVLEGRITHDASHPLYGTWEVEGQVLNPTETKIDSIMKGLCTDYVHPYSRTIRFFYAFTQKLMYTMQSSRVWIDKMKSDGKTSFVTLEPYRTTQANSNTLIDVNWSVHWLDSNTILICRDKQDLSLPVPKCFVLKRKVGDTSLINVIGRRLPVNSHI